VAKTAINESVADAIIGRGVGKRPPFHVADGIEWGQLYFAGAGYKAPLPVGIPEPPNTGWSTAFVLAEDERHVTVFHLWSMQSWRVARACYEMSSFQSVGYETEFPTARFTDALPRYYAEHRRRGDGAKDYATAARIMEALGIKVPTDDELGDVPALERPLAVVQHAPKPLPKAADKPFKPVKRDGRRGEVLQFFLDGGGSASVSAATTKFSITRSNLLSQLFLLRKEHGIGYGVNGDVASVQLPEGVTEPFA
jgi:hypothetical protein